ncbi:MAG TPA: hypothetical protein VIV11_33785 [Kofleriaceae bacterium]
MAVARVALALVLVASVGQTGEAEPCAPRADLGGDAEAVAKVAAELERLGVDANTDPTKRAPTKCPVIIAAVELDRSGGIAVAVRDSSLRSEGRVVSDAALAAAWIDSWLRDDFTAPPSETPLAVTPVAPVREQPTAVVAQTPVLERFSLAASYLQMWSDDSTSWSGFAGSLCVQVNGFCVGARVGYASQIVPTDVSAAAKTDLSLLATASYSWRLGRLSLAPELGVGVGRLVTERYEGCTQPAMMTPTMCDPMTDPMCMNCDPTDPMCGITTEPPKCEDPGTTTVYVGDNFSTATYTPRVMAALRIAVPLFDHVWLDGVAAATAAPFGHDDDYGEGQTMIGTMPNTASFPLPGDPMFGFQLGVGLRLGAP